MSVNSSLVSCLRYRCSRSYLCISPLHDLFRLLRLNSRLTVSMAVLQLSCRLSPLTYKSACGPFKPTDSGERLHPPYYRGCWHGVSRCLFSWYLQLLYTRGGLFPSKSSLQSRGPSSCTRHGWFRLSSIDQYSSLLPPVGVWSVSQYQCGGSPSQAPYPSKPW
jgi:hypothetical protein